MYWIVIHARNSVFYITTTSFVDHFGRRRSSPLLWKVLLIQPILVVGGGLSKWLDLLMCIWGRSHIESKINFDSLFGKPHVGGPCSVCQGGQHSLFCLQSWNALHFLWIPDRQLACVWGLMCVKNVSLNTRVPLRSEVCTLGGAQWAATDWGSWGGMLPSLLSLTLGREVIGWVGWLVCTCLPPSFA